MRDTPVILISDIHGNRQALEAFDEDIHRVFETPEKIPLINCGDILDYGANPEECIKILSKYNVVISCIGNHDEAILRGTHDKRFDTPHGRLALEITRNSLKRETIEYLNNNMVNIGCYEDIIAFHGMINDIWGNLYPFSEELDKWYEKEKIYVFGHSHLQFSFTHNDSLFINPGSIGQPRNGIAKCHYSILYPDNRVELKKIEYDIDGAANEIVKKGYPKFLATRLYLGI